MKAREVYSFLSCQEDCLIACGKNFPQGGVMKAVKILQFDLRRQKKAARGPLVLWACQKNDIYFLRRCRSMAMRVNPASNPARNPRNRERPGGYPNQLAIRPMAPPISRPRITGWLVAVLIYFFGTRTPFVPMRLQKDALGVDFHQ